MDFSDYINMNRQATFVKIVEDRDHEGFYKILIEVAGIRFESVSIHRIKELELENKHTDED